MRRDIFGVVISLAIISSMMVLGIPKAVAQGRPSFSDNRPTPMGLSTDRGLGLGVGRGARYDAPFLGGFRRYGAIYRSSYGLGYAPRYHYGHSVPWEPIPQTLKRHVDHPALYATPRLGLHYSTYPPLNDIGLNLPPEPEDPIASAHPVPDDVVEPISPALAEALLHMKQGRYARAGRVLAGELKHPPVPLETSVVIAEILVATGHYTAAAKVFRYALEEAPELGALSGMRIADHFPSANAFGEKLEALAKADVSSERADEVVLLRAGLRLLSGDAEAVKELEPLQDGRGKAAGAAKRLYLHFLDGLFGSPAQGEGEE